MSSKSTCRQLLAGHVLEVRKGIADRLLELAGPGEQAALTCFLQQSYFIATPCPSSSSPVSVNGSVHTT